MQVNNAFRRRDHPDEHGTWGNRDVDAMVQEFPWIVQIVRDLRFTKEFASHKQGEWSALFFEDTVGDKTEISVEFKPSRSTLRVKPMPLVEGQRCEMTNIRIWIINNIQRST